MINFCNQTIARYLPHPWGILDKSWQRDPFIKMYLAISLFLNVHPEDKNARQLLHELEPKMSGLLKASVKNKDIKAANTILQAIRQSIHKNAQPIRKKRAGYR